MKRLLHTPLFHMLLGGSTFLASMALFLQGPLSGAAAAQQTAAPTPTHPPFWGPYNAEADQLLEEIKREKAELARKESELKELLDRLQSERAELTVITQRVHQMQLEFDQHVVKLGEQEAPNLKKLARMYAAMSPEGTTAILKELEDEAVVKILAQMKETDSAPILDSLAREGELQAKRAAAISEALRRVLPPNSK